MQQRAHDEQTNEVIKRNEQLMVNDSMPGASLIKIVKHPSACRGRALSKFYGQATKGAWWMPWQKQAMKDVASCDKPRGAASRH